MWVVVMFEPADMYSEHLSLAQQTNEIFGPFVEEKAADEFAARMAEIYKDKRQWLICPLSNPTVVNKLDPRIN